MNAARALTVSFVLALFACVPSAALAQCADWWNGPLQNSQAGNGADGNVNALYSWDPDGTGPLSARLVAGGTFSTIGGVTTGTVAYLDPSSGTWQRFAASSPFSDVRAFTSFNNQLVVGSAITWDLDHTITARWDGTGWSALGRDLCRSDFRNMKTDWTRALTVWNSQLVAGGNNTVWGDPGPAGSCTGQYGYGVAFWDGASHWRHGNDYLGSYVRALVPWNGELVAGTENFGSSGSRVSSYDGTTWHAFGAAGNNSVHALQPWNGVLAAGGAFTQIGGVNANRVAYWNGTTWTALGTGMSGSVNCFAVFNGQLVAGGDFLTASGQSVNYVARWDGSAWQPLASGVNASVEAMTVHNGELIVGGQFTLAGGRPANHIARWDGAQWSSFGGGTASGVYAFGAIGSRLVVGGDFHQSTRSAQQAHSVLTWDGMGFSALGTGMNSTVRAFKTFKYTGINGSTELLAGGSFTTAGSLAANRIARWTEKPFVAFPPPAWEAMGAGFNNSVHAIERFSNATYAGGTFTLSGATGVNRIARWNETTDVWEPMSTGLNGPVYALKVFGSYLYVGGAFTTAGGVTANGLARWDGTSWSAVTSALTGTVYALDVHGSDLVIGGSFTTTVGSSNLAFWNGSSLTGHGSPNGTVLSLRSTGTRLYAGGDFTTVGAAVLPRVAWWDGAWHAAGGGADASVRALAAYNGEMQAGGTFAFVDAGTTAAPGWARWLETGAPWIAQSPVSRTADSRGDVSFTAQLAAGFEGATLRWLRNGTPLADGMTLSGSNVSGAGTLTLTLSRVQQWDAGQYALSAINACGGDTSFAATLTINQVTDVAPDAAVASAFHGLAPNPSRGGTQVSFTLARAAHVQLRVHDVLGRRVAEVDLGALAAGRHATAWDAGGARGTRLPAGLYMVELRADDARLGVRRFVMLR